MLHIDELCIYVYEGACITNIAFMEDLLIVQVREPFFPGAHVPLIPSPQVP